MGCWRPFGFLKVVWLSSNLFHVDCKIECDTNIHLRITGFFLETLRAPHKRYTNVKQILQGIYFCKAMKFIYISVLSLDKYFICVVKLSWRVVAQKLSSNSLRKSITQKYLLNCKVLLFGEKKILLFSYRLMQSKFSET